MIELDQKNYVFWKKKPLHVYLTLAQHLFPRTLCMLSVDNLQATASGYQSPSIQRDRFQVEIYQYR
jgi:hypothetical protein